MNTKQINEAAANHALQQLGDDQFKNNKLAVKAIKEDFKAGYKRCQDELSKEIEELTVKYEGLLNEFSAVFSKKETPLKAAIKAIQQNQEDLYYGIIKHDLLEIIDRNGGISQIEEYLSEIN